MLNLRSFSGINKIKIGSGIGIGKVSSKDTGYANELYFSLLTKNKPPT